MLNLPPENKPWNVGGNFKTRNNKMNSFFNFQFGEFSQASPNWFDWFSLISSLIISAASIFLAFYIAERIYKREKLDKEKESIDLQNSEIELFKNNLTELNTAIEKQIIDLQKYSEEKNFKLTFNQSVQVDFFQFVKIQHCIQQRFALMAGLAENPQWHSCLI